LFDYTESDLNRYYRGLRFSCTYLLTMQTRSLRFYDSASDQVK